MYVVGSFHNDISYAPVVDEDSLEALGLLSDHVPHHHQPIQTQYYYIALLERSPLVPHTYYGGRHHQSNKICEDEKGRPRRLESNSKIVDSRLWTGLVQLSLLFYYMKKYFLVCLEKRIHRAPQRRTRKNPYKKIEASAIFF